MKSNREDSSHRRRPTWPFGDRDMVTRTHLLSVRVEGRDLLASEIVKARRLGETVPLSTSERDPKYRCNVTRYRWRDVRQWAQSRDFVLKHEPRIARQRWRPQRPNADMLTSRDAATYIGMSESWMSKSRLNGDGSLDAPPFHRIRRTIRYRRSELDEWLAAHHEDAPADAGPTNHPAAA